jgi:hypothetical protein
MMAVSGCIVIQYTSLFFPFCGSRVVVGSHSLKISKGEKALSLSLFSSFPASLFSFLFSPLGAGGELKYRKGSLSFSSLQTKRERKKRESCSR